MEKPYRGLVLFGPPGVGKGVQAALLAKNYGLVHLSTGDLIREEIRQETELGLRVKAAVERGEFADDETVLGIVMSRIDRPEFQGGFVMDGFPRNIHQAEMLDRLLSQRGRMVSHAIFIVAPDEVVLGRLGGRRVCSGCGATYNVVSKPPGVEGVCDSCGGSVGKRKDDDPQVHRDRLAEYHRQTAPLVDYFRRTGVLRNVSGDQSIEEVASEIEKIIESGP